jgi:hypothetical protein
MYNYLIPLHKAKLTIFKRLILVESDAPGHYTIANNVRYLRTDWQIQTEILLNYFRFCTLLGQVREVASVEQVVQGLRDVGRGP